LILICRPFLRILASQGLQLQKHPHPPPLALFAGPPVPTICPTLTVIRSILPAMVDPRAVAPNILVEAEPKVILLFCQAP
jgi:hypothetical protein